MNEKNIKIEHALWDLFNYSSLYVIALDSDFKIQLCSYALAKILGYDTEDEILGKNFLRFILPEMTELISYVGNEVLKNNDCYNEFTNEIVSINGDIVKVKWFNSKINGNINWLFSIGIPLTKEVTIQDNIETIRAYYKNVLEKDKTMFQAIKEIGLSA